MVHCLICTVRALLAGEPPPLFPDREARQAHETQAHPDRYTRLHEQQQLEQQLYETNPQVYADFFSKLQ